MPSIDTPVMGRRPLYLVVLALSLSVVLLIGGAGVNSRSATLAGRPPVSGPDETAAAIPFFEQNIPFAIRFSSVAGPQCDALDINVVIRTDADGRDLDYRWQAMDRGTVLLECGDFYDLYYRCDAPACLNVRVITELESGQTIAGKTGHICIE